MDANTEESFSRSVVLTSNERLRRALVRTYDAARIHSGRRAWVAPRIFSTDAWLAQQYELARAQHPGLPRPLDTGAELLLWRTTAPSGQESLAALARDAWKICWQWNIAINAETLRKTENSRLFHHWAERFASRLREIGAVSRAELATMLTEVPPPSPDRVLCFALESPASDLNRYLAHLAEGGWRLTVGEAPLQETGDCVRVAFADARQELSAAAQWCRQVLLRQPDASVGIVVPDLTQRYEAVSRQFSAWLQHPEQFGAARIYDIAGGTPLSEQPVWQAASLWLRFCFSQLSAAHARQMLRSPYLELPDVPALPSVLPETFGAAALSRVSDEPFWRAIARERPDPARQATLSAWIDDFRQLLARGGWTARRAASGQYQAFEQLTTVLSQTGRHPVSQRRCDALEALDTLGQLIGDRLFAPEQPPARVQILGYLETTGLTFSHLWVLGMQDTDWPLGISPNPLVPLSTQIEHQVPRVSADSELAFAERRVRQWQASAEQIVFSYATTVDGISRGSSPLLDHLPHADPYQLVAELMAASHPALVQRNVVLEPRPESRGSVVSAGLVRGGSNLLKDQAQCPFRAWAMHRLGIEAPREPHAFPDALDRGQLLHTLMQLLLQRGSGGPAHPDELDEAELSTQIGRALQRTYRRFPESYRQRESQRLETLLQLWLTLEKARATYRVEAVEQSVEMELAGLTLNLRLDRLDRLLDPDSATSSQVAGDLLVLDYKTGRVQPKHLLEDRLLDPQLPLYAMANPAVKGVLYVQMADREVRLAGIAAASLDLSPARTLEAPEGDWDALRERWQDQLTGLAEEFRQGIAVADPASSETCRYCHLQPFCRIGENNGGHPENQTIVEGDA